MKITIGAPKSDVTAEIFSSVGAKRLLAKRSLNMQNTEPAMNVAGKRTIGLEVFNISLIKKGTAIPINDTGPTKAVTHAERILERRMTSLLVTLIFTPTLLA